MTNATTVPGGLAAREPATPPARTPAEIEAEIERTRARLADTVDAIADAGQAGQRGPAHVRRRRREPPGKRVAVLAVVVAAVAGLVRWRRSRCAARTPGSARWRRDHRLGGLGPVKGGPAPAVGERYSTV